MKWLCWEKWRLRVPKNIKNDAKRMTEEQAADFGFVLNYLSSTANVKSMIREILLLINKRLKGEDGKE